MTNPTRGFECHLWNVKTGREKPLLGLTQARNALGEEKVDNDSLSPDGRWYIVSERWGRYLISSIDGTNTHIGDTGSGTNYRNVVWFPDSTRWLEIFQNGSEAYQVNLHDVLRPRFCEAISLKHDALLLGKIQSILPSGPACVQIHLSPHLQTVGAVGFPC